MLIAIIVLALGVAALWVAGEQFVLGATRVAEKTGMPTILVGMIVAGFGTSMPELAVSVIARINGQGEVALGNALGSNVANVTLALPLSALAATWIARGELLRREVWSVLAGTVLALALVADGVVVRTEAVVLIVAFAGIMGWLTRSSLRDKSRASVEKEIEDLVGTSNEVRLGKESLRTLVGLAGILIAADRMVWSASTIAREVGLSEAVIGLTIVAVGTSLPEIVTGVVAARKGEAEIVLGNILGSNLFNILLIVGIGGVIGPLRLSGAELTTAMIGVAVSTLMLTAFLKAEFKLSKGFALTGLVIYVFFAVALYAV